jgi:PAS domain S-box-containing protein
MLEGELFALLESTSDAAFTVDEQGAIRSWNASAEALFGYSSAEVLRKSCHEVLKGRCGPATQACAVNGCGVPAFDMEVRAPSGRRIWVNVSTLIYRDARHGRRLVVHLARDITGRKRGEELVRKVVDLSRQLTAVTESAGRTTPSAQLSEQERRILRSFSKGGNSAEIARELGITLQTLRNHLHRVNQKLGTRNRLEAVMTAIERSLI